MADKIYLATKENVESLGSQIEPIVQDYLDDCYIVIQEKGGTVPEVKNLRNLETSIRSIEDHMDEIVDGTVDTVTTDATSIRPYAFYHYNGIRKVIAPNALTIGDYAFQYSGIIDTKEVQCPGMKNIPQYCFSNCVGIYEVDDDRIETTGTQSFSSCTGLTRVNLPNCTYIGTSTFANCANLTSINFPNCEYIGQGSFNGCNNLVEAIFPKANHPVIVPFGGNQKLERVVIGGDYLVENKQICNSCPVLKTLEFPNMGVDYVFTQTSTRTGLKSDVVIVCNDGTIEYINGAWTIVRD